MQSSLLWCIHTYTQKHLNIYIYIYIYIRIWKVQSSDRDSIWPTFSNSGSLISETSSISPSSIFFFSFFIIIIYFFFLSRFVDSSLLSLSMAFSTFSSHLSTFSHSASLTKRSKTYKTTYKEEERKRSDVGRRKMNFFPRKKIHYCRLLRWLLKLGYCFVLICEASGAFICSRNTLLWLFFVSVIDICSRPSLMLLWTL